MFQQLKHLCSDEPSWHPKEVMRYQSDYIHPIGMTMVSPHIVSIFTAVVSPEYLSALPIYVLENIFIAIVVRVVVFGVVFFFSLS